jgi:hypothetical protein
VCPDLHDKQYVAEIEPVVRKILEQLTPYEVTAPAAWANHATPDTIFPGQCFDRSFHFVQSSPTAYPAGDPAEGETWLVHGEYQGSHRHAWVELSGGVVLDGVTQRFYSRGGYYQAVGARPYYMYSPGAAVLISIRMPQYENGAVELGGWHQHLGLPNADPRNPIRIDVDEAIRLLNDRGLIT